MSEIFISKNINFSFFKSLLFRNGQSYCYERWCAFDRLLWTLLKVQFCNFSQNKAKVVSVSISKIAQNSTALRKIDRLFQRLLFKSDFQNSMRAFSVDLVQIRRLCSFEDIGRSCFHAKLCMTADLMQITADLIEILKTAQRDLTFILNVFSESSIHFTQILIVLAKKCCQFT